MIRLPLALAAAAVLASPPALAQPVSQGDMPRFCSGQASAHYDVNPRDIRTLPAERTATGWSVPGQTPPDGSNATFFECTFDDAGSFVAVNTTGAGAASGQAVAVGDMARFCQGEASAKFGVNPRGIQMQPVVEIDGGHAAYGEYEEGGSYVGFECIYGAAGYLLKVEKK